MSSDSFESEVQHEYQCPICHTTVVGEREKEDHARSEPGLQPSSMIDNGPRQDTASAKKELREALQKCRDDAPKGNIEASVGRAYMALGGDVNDV